MSVDPDHVWCDAAELKRHADEGQLEEVVRLYQGRFLDGIQHPTSDLYNLWIDDERRRLKKLARDAAAGLADRAESLEEKEDWLQKGFEIAPSDEAIARRLMRVCCEQDNLGRALEVHEHLVRHLELEFGAPPSSKTSELADSIRTLSSN